MIDLSIDAIFRIIEVTVIALAILIMPRMLIQQLKNEIQVFMARFRKKGVEDIISESLGLDPTIVKMIMEYVKPYLNNTDKNNDKEMNKYNIWA
jgi:predicted metal-dependent hydrolase